MDKMLVPNVSIIRRFYCSYTHLLCTIQSSTCSTAGGGATIEGVNAFTDGTMIQLTGLIPDTKYLVTVKAENRLFGIENTTLRSDNISITLLEGGINGIAMESKYHNLSFFVEKYFWTAFTVRNLLRW